MDKIAGGTTCNRRVFLKGIGLVGIALVPFLKACGMRGESQPAEAKLDSSVMKSEAGKSRPPIPPIDAAAPGLTETATFALGWFWGPDAQFGRMPGVVRTRVGYSGGTRKNPTYHDLGDHSETLQIDFDPARISYEKLLDIFWKSHEPTARSWSRQYRAAVFFENEIQKKIALETRYREALRGRGEIFTEILPATQFYRAEDYHQKYYLQLDRFFAGEFQKIYPDFKDVVNSTAAARVNGYLGGHGTGEITEEDLTLLGLSPEAHKRLVKIVASGHWSVDPLSVDLSPAPLT